MSSATRPTTVTSHASRFSIAAAFERLYFLERACQAQILALSTGRRLRIVPDAIAKATAAQFRDCT